RAASRQAVRQARSLRRRRARRSRLRYRRRSRRVRPAPRRAAAPPPRSRSTLLRPSHRLARDLPSADRQGRRKSVPQSRRRCSHWPPPRSLPSRFAPMLVFLWHHGGAKRCEWQGGKQSRFCCAAAASVRLIARCRHASVTINEKKTGRIRSALAIDKGEETMKAKLIAVAAAALAVVSIGTANAAEPKHGGILKFYHRETPPSLSILEEATFSVNAPAMAFFNNLVVYDQHKPQNSDATIVPELATSWSWDKANTALTFKLREGVTWHDGKPFTSKDVKCTMDLLLDKNPNDKLRKNPRKGWFEEIGDVTTNGDFEVTMHLKRPQPSLLAMFASGYTPMYPCHVPSAQQRTHPIGTGPFMFGEEKQNESIKLVKNPHYWKKGLPYLD